MYCLKMAKMYRWYTCDETCRRHAFNICVQLILCTWWDKLNTFTVCRVAFFFQLYIIVSGRVKLISAYTICKRAGHQQCRNHTESALGQMCTNPGLLGPRTTKFCMVMPNICNIIFARLSSSKQQCESVHMHLWDSQLIPEFWVLSMTLPFILPSLHLQFQSDCSIFGKFVDLCFGDLWNLTRLSSLEKEYKSDVNALH